ncbi:MAG: GGDEF domain-containing protein [Actinobacteria bacterium]|nr:MAG: GGDEF domain-containing protein [Actinomycetota bacterium]
MIAVLIVAVFVTWVSLAIGGSSVEHAADDAMTAAAALAAAVCCFWAAKRHRAELRRFWVLMGCAMAAWSVGEIVWGFYEVVLGQTVPALSLADVGYLGAVPLAAAALLFYPSESASGSPRVRALLDGLIVAGSVLLVSWVLVLKSVVHASGASPLATSVQLAYPLGDAVIVALVVIALARTPTSARRSLGWVLTGLAAMAVADSGFVYLTAVGGYATGDLIDTGWLVAYLAIALGALHAVLNRACSVSAPVESQGSLRRSMLVYAPSVAALVLAAATIVRGGVIDRVLWMTVLGTVVLVIARQVLAVAENATLTATVEAKVIARTDELRHQALHDALTGLPNRSLIMDRIEQLLARGRRTDTRGAALYLDLDGFKTVNDSLGHAQGDRLLQAVAIRLASGLRDADTLGRMGGDEFVILLDGDELVTTVELIAQRLIEVLHQPFEINGVPLAITASIGIATGDRASAGDLLRDADVALYEAKALGKNRYACYQPEMQDAIHDRLACLPTDLPPPDHGYGRCRSALALAPLHSWRDRSESLHTAVGRQRRHHRRGPLGAHGSLPAGPGVARPGQPAECLGERLGPSTRQRQHHRRCSARPR